MSARTGSLMHRFRHHLVLWLLLAGFGLLAARAAHLQLLEHEFLQSKGDVNYLTVQTSHANRGMILDRNGEPLAVSSAVDSVVADPKAIFRDGGFDAQAGWDELAELIGESRESIRERIVRNADSEFAWLKRHLDPERARQVAELGIAGITLRREYKRFYPGGPVFGHVVGFTDTDQNGLGGVEKVFDEQLSGTPGRTRVLRDGRGRVIEHVEQLAPVVDGEDVRLSIDARLQYLAFRHLKAAVKKHRADAASVVLIDARTGEILAMVNEPTINPNTRERAELSSSSARNRALQSIFEPGSTIKPFTVAAALASGRFGPDSRIETSPGVITVGGYPIRDFKDYGLLTVSRILIKSSNVGIAKVAMELDPTTFPAHFRDLGFGRATGIPLPGEESGRAPAEGPLRQRDQASLAYGYGLSTNLLQLARAYTVLAGDGRLLEVRLTPGQAEHGGRVYPPEVASQVRSMLAKVISGDGTGTGARLADYTAAGKTGTVIKYLVEEGRYADDQYMSVFAGFAPAENPRLIMAGVLDNPRGEAYYGGQVSAPVFSRVMNSALHLLNVPSRPDDDKPDLLQARLDGESDT